jgi:hypothetical protein
MDWIAIASLVPGRTEKQCNARWHDVLNPSIALTARRAAAWTEEEDLNLKNSVEIHGGKDWEAIATLVPGRTKVQCRKRWWDTLVSNIDRHIRVIGQKRKTST